MVFDKFSCDTTAGCVKTKGNLHTHENHMPLAVQALTTHHRHIMIWISFEYLMNIFHRKIHTIEFAPFNNNINIMSSGKKNISKARCLFLKSWLRISSSYGHEDDSNSNDDAFEQLTPSPAVYSTTLQVKRKILKWGKWTLCKIKVEKLVK